MQAYIFHREASFEPDTRMKAGKFDKKRSHTITWWSVSCHLESNESKPLLSNPKDRLIVAHPPCCFYPLIPVTKLTPSRNRHRRYGRAQVSETAAAAAAAAGTSVCFCHMRCFSGTRCWNQHSAELREVMREPSISSVAKYFYYLGSVWPGVVCAIIVTWWMF